jgi:hypothetical protein
MAKINKKELIKHVKALNAWDLLEEKIKTKGDPEEILADFMDGIEEIDDDNNIGEVPDDILDYYESMGDDDEDEEEEKPKKGKKGKKEKPAKKGKKAKKDEEEEEEEDDDEDEEDEEEEEEDDEEEEKPKKGKKGKKEKPAKAAKKAKKAKDEDDDDDDEEDDDEEEDEEEDEDEEEEKPVKGKKGKKDKKAKKEKSDLPKGIRKDTIPAKLYTAIADGGATLKDLAKIVGKEKKKDADKCLNIALRTIARKVSKNVDIAAVFTGGEESKIKFHLVEDSDE